MERIYDAFVAWVDDSMSKVARVIWSLVMLVAYEVYKRIPGTER